MPVHRNVSLVAHGALAMIALLALAGVLVVSHTAAPVTAAAGPAATVARPTAPGSAALRVEIPTLGVDVEVLGVGLLADGALDVPRADVAGWYAAGPEPGMPGPAVVVGHVDSPAGPGVFSRLGEVRRGDRVLVRGSGRFHEFVVQQVERAPKDRLPVDRIWAAADEPLLRLVTCGGEVDGGHYRDNVIVYAAPAWRGAGS